MDQVNMESGSKKIVPNSFDLLKQLVKKRKKNDFPNYL